MAGPVYHATWCYWLRGGPCNCGGNRAAKRPESLTICSVCTDTPCSCDRYADAEVEDAAS